MSFAGRKDIIKQYIYFNLLAGQEEFTVHVEYFC